MAVILSKIGFTKKPNTKVYNLNPAVRSLSGKKLINPDLHHKQMKASYGSTINKPHHRSPKSTFSRHSDLVSLRKKQKNDYSEYGSFENQTVKAMADYSVDKAEKTTEKINGCLKVAEELSDGASKLLVNLHQQSEQITQTHQTATTIDHVLKRGEKLLEGLGGLFSRRWKPKKSREIKGPLLTKDESFTRKCYYMEQRKKLGLTPPKSQSNARHFPSGSSSALERVKLEKAKQDDALSELSNLLGKLKAMAVGMGSEIDRQNTALDRMQDDVDELNIRMKGANLRARELLR